jgi:hypothetical protein
MHSRSAQIGVNQENTGGGEGESAGQIHGDKRLALFRNRAGDQDGADGLAFTQFFQSISQEPKGFGGGAMPWVMDRHMAIAPVRKSDAFHFIERSLLGRCSRRRLGRKADFDRLHIDGAAHSLFLGTVKRLKNSAHDSPLV